MWAYVISDKEGNIYWGEINLELNPLLYKKIKGIDFSSSQSALIELNSKDKLNISNLNILLLQDIKTLILHHSIMDLN